MNSSVKSTLTVLLAALCFWALPTHATVIVYIVTPLGIIMGADGRTFHPHGCGRDEPPSTAVKVLVLKHRFILASDQLLKMQSTDQKAMLYDFSAFAKSIDAEIRPNATVSALSDLVEGESAQKLSFVSNEMDRLRCLWNGSPAENALLAEYIVAGYKSGAPIINKIEVNVAQDGSIVHWQDPAPLRPGEHIDARAGEFASTVSTDICDSGSDAYRIAGSTFPSQRHSFCQKDFSQLTLDQVSDIVRVLIEVDSDIRPEWVGFPITVVILPKNEKGKSRSYCRPFPSHPSQLSKEYNCEK